MPSFLYENQYAPTPVIGLDEAGCGPWAGPVVAGAVYFKSQNYDEMPWLKELDDSKKLTAKKREKLYQQIISAKELLCYGVGFISSIELDKLGLSLAISGAMAKALDQITYQIEDSENFHLLIDGIRKPKFNRPMTTLVKGDQKSLSIAAASIMAKVSRDRYMKELDKKYPQYKWASNAGYGTKYHQEAIAKFGICEQHRKSFKPIQKVIGKS